MVEVGELRCNQFSCDKYRRKIKILEPDMVLLLLSGTDIFTRI